MPLITTSTTPQEIFPKNTARKSFTIKNADATITVYVKKERAEKTTVSSSNYDHPIGPGGSISLNSTQDGDQAIKERWTVVAASGTPTVAWFETEDINR